MSSGLHCFPVAAPALLPRMILFAEDPCICVLPVVR
jgi:hypothetical protein